MLAPTKLTYQRCSMYAPKFGSTLRQLSKKTSNCRGQHQPARCSSAPETDMEWMPADSLEKETWKEESRKYRRAASPLFPGCCTALAVARVAPHTSRLA